MDSFHCFQFHNTTKVSVCRDIYLLCGRDEAEGPTSAQHEHEFLTLVAVPQICISAPLSTATRCRRISVNPSCAGTILPLMVLHSNVHLVQSYVNKGFPAWEKIKNKHNKPQNVSSTAHFQLITDAVHLSKTHKNRYLSYNMGQN